KLGSSAMKNIDFWFSIGSTYTYLTVMRMKEIERKEGVTFTWRPFSVRALMLEMNNRPFIGKPVKAQYMWRDIERRAARYGIPVKVPAPYPLEHFDLVNRIAVLAARDGWCEDYVRTSYVYWFQKGIPAGEGENLKAALEHAGQPVERILERADSKEIEDAYHAATAEARELGIFGSPSFIAGGKELFWGDDRLEDAIAWQR
ncbi:MAG: 2-hydroxychromene-2-carboxylate isomerase, partial [Rhodospirillaceae bacterium]